MRDVNRMKIPDEYLELRRKAYLSILETAEAIKAKETKRANSKALKGGRMISSNDYWSKVRSELWIRNALKKLKVGERFAMISPEGMRVFKLEEITDIDSIEIGYSYKTIIVDELVKCAMGEG